MKKRVYIVHGWGGHPEEGWFPWLRQELVARGYDVFLPKMPNTEVPTIQEWVTYLAELVGKADEQTYFVGHSIGCQAIMRYLETLGGKIGGAVFVAGWFVLNDLNEWEIPIAKPWLETPINFEKVRQTTDSITVIISDDDPFGGLEENKRIFSEKIGAKICIEAGKGHFSEEDGVFKLPNALNTLIRIAK
jgi:uncharacterized protein